jgi:DNA helicase II / ATP-dependent DNA helicase PcrA
MTFNPSVQQLAVADWITRGKGHLNLVARAGCGKTSTLLWVTPLLHGSAIFLAFNKSIADEIKGKLKAQGIDWKQCEGATFHSIGFRAWRKAHPSVQVDDRGQKVPGIIDTMAKDALQHNNSRLNCILADASQFLCQLVSLAKQQAFGYEKAGSDQDWLDIISHHDMEHETDATDQELVTLAKDIYQRSIALNHSIVDFDDMLLAPLVGNVRFWQYDWVMVDEAQDTNPARRALALRLLKRGGRLIAVGDPKQAIYGFTGADSNAMDIIAQRLGSTTLPLNVTYRCPKAVVAHANLIVPDLEAHETAPEGSVLEMPWLPPQEGADSFQSLIPTLGADDAILCRNTKPLVSLAYTMISKGKGCHIEGRDIGYGLIKLATKWKRVKGIQALRNKLAAYASAEIAKAMSKGQESKAQSIEDRVDALMIICDHVGLDGTVDQLVDQIKGLFGDTPAGQRPKVVTLSTVHKSKGREWQRVFILDRAALMPSKWARQPWAQEQEQNLIYVAITRAKDQLVEVYGYCE